MSNFGGVVDGVKFSELTNYNTRNFTVINVLENTNGTLFASSGSQYAFSLHGKSGNDASITTSTPILSVSGQGLPPGEKHLFTVLNGLPDGPTFDYITNPQLSAGNMISIIRSTDNTNNNVNGRNEWDVNNTDPGVSYNQVNNFPLASADTLDFSGNTPIGNFSPHVVLGGYASTDVSPSIAFPWRGKISESMVFNKALTDADLNAVVSYLKTKYGVI